jgi:H+/Cl- antiporter ClcA
MAENLFARGVSHGFIIIMVGIIGGVLGGISGILFISILNYAQNLRELSPYWVLTLPLSGILITLLRGAPKLIFGSFLTHLGGGSAGREGAVIQLSKTLSVKIAGLLKFQERKLQRLILVSMGAGFGAALGAPFAGLIFGFEFNKSKIFRPWTLIQSSIAMFIAQALMRMSKLEHFHLPQFDIPLYQTKTFALVMISGILFGFTTAFFHFLRHQCEHAFSKTTPMITAIMGGTFLSMLFYFLGLKEFQGLGRETIILASQENLPLIFTVKKMIISAITLGTGFQGGEFFPLAFMGSTIGSAFGFIEPSVTALLAGLGFVSTYAASTQTPIACAILAGELFGWEILPFAAITVWIANRIHSRISTPTKE